MVVVVGACRGDIAIAVRCRYVLISQESESESKLELGLLDTEW